MTEKRLRIKSKGDRLWLLVLTATLINLGYQTAKQITIIWLNWSQVWYDTSVWTFLFFDLIGVVGVLWFIRKYILDIRAKEKAAQ